MVRIPQCPAIEIRVKPNPTGAGERMCNQTEQEKEILAPS